MERPTRRDLLRATPLAMGALAGCDGFGGGEVETPSSDGKPATTTLPPPSHTLELRNETESERYVSVVVREADSVRSSTTVAVPARSSRRFTIAAEPGVLGIELETTDGVTATHPWVVGEKMSNLVVSLTADDVAFSQRAWCTPECSPISKDGTAAEFPYYGGKDQMSYYGANVVLVNTTDGTVAVDVDIRHEGNSILDYEYVIPPGMTVEFPGVHSAGDYTVHAETAMGSVSYEWQPPKERRLQIRLTDSGVHTTCGQSTASLILVNQAESTQQVVVSASRPDSTRTEFRYSDILAPNARHRVREVYTGSGHYVLDVGTSTGASTTYDWWLCPPRGPTEITIQPNGELHVVQYQPGE